MGYQSSKIQHVAISPIMTWLNVRRGDFKSGCIIHLGHNRSRDTVDALLTFLDIVTKIIFTYKR